jgi:hypothetical protein
MEFYSQYPQAHLGSQWEFQSAMLIHTAEGKRSIDEDLVLCIDRHRGESERCIVTVYLLTGEQLTGILETAPADDDSPPLAA